MTDRDSSNSSAPQDLDGIGNGDFLTIAEVLKRTTLSRSLFYRLLPTEQLPPLLKPGVRSRGMTEDMLDAWFESRMALRAQMRVLEDFVRLPPWERRRPSGEHPLGIRMMTRAQVVRRVGRGKTEIYRLIGLGAFPRPVPLTERRRAWVQHEVEEWRRVVVEDALRVRGLSIGELVRKHLLSSGDSDETSDSEHDHDPGDPGDPGDPVL